MTSFLTTPAIPRSESLAFLSLSANDLDCFDARERSAKSSSSQLDRCVLPKVQALSQEDHARTALCDLICSLAQSQSLDEFVARRDRLFPQYSDLMLGLGRIVNALTDRAQLILKTKSQLAAEEKFFSNADSRYCPESLRDQALFSLWELGKIVDLVDFIISRPLASSKREEDQRLGMNCTSAVLIGRFHLDCLAFSIAAEISLSEEIQDALSEGMRHVVNGHIAARLGARLRQENLDMPEVELLPLDEEDRLSLSHAMAGFEDDEY